MDGEPKVLVLNGHRSTCLRPRRNRAGQLQASFLGSCHGNIGAVAGGAILGRGLVKQDLFVGHFLE